MMLYFDASIVQMIRDRIRFSFLQLRDRTREYKLVKEVGRTDGQVGSAGPL